MSGFSRVRPIFARARWNVRRAVAAVARAVPGRCVGDIDIPSELPHDSTTIHGWAVSSNDIVQAVIVAVDGERRLATSGIARPYVERARRRGPVAPNAGWELPIDVRDRVGDSLQISADVITASGLVERLEPRTVEVVARPLSIIEHPTPGGMITAGFTHVWGSALASVPVSRVDVFVNGVAVGPARLYSDITPEHASTCLPGASLARWASLLDLRDVTPGTPVEIAAKVTYLSGAAAPVESVRAVACAVASPSYDVRTAQVLAAVDAGPLASGSETADLRVLVVTHDLGFGGGQLYLSELLQQLHELTSWSFVVVAPRDGPLRSSLESMGCEVHLVGEYPFVDPIAFEAKVLELRLLARKAGCSVVLVNTVTAGIGADVGRRLCLPVVWAIHESFAFDEYFVAPNAHPAVKESLRAALVASDAVVFEADATRRMYEVEGDSDRFVTVRYGVATDRIAEYVEANSREELRARNGFSGDQTLLLCMGTFEPRKAQAMLATAFAAIADRHPSAVLVMVGDRDHPYCDALREHIGSLDLAERVIALPIVADPWQWYRMADLLVSASDLESMPRSVIEAMAFGLPVLAADAFGVRELIDDGAHGWLCPVRDTRALRDALDSVLSLPADLREAVADKARARVRAEHDSASYGAAFEALLSGVVREPTAQPRELLSRVS